MIFDDFNLNEKGGINSGELLKFFHKIDKELKLALTTEEQLEKVKKFFDIDKCGELHLDEVYPLIVYTIAMLAGYTKD